nr:mitochondrial inner membrane protease ATP23 homolog [Rhipicephalus microplus]
MSNAQQTNSQPDDSSKKEAKPEQSYGFESYPERRGGKKPENWLRIALFGEGRENLDNIRCEKNVVDCVKDSPLVKLMISALKSAGCDIDIRRNICCEPCEGLVTGGFDTEYNQVVVCQNKARSRGTVQGVLAHELMHMFDYCRAHMDFKNMDHLACTEVRAANLFHCSFMSAMSQGSASPFNIARSHAECVKQKAVSSIVVARGVSQEEARSAVDRIFDKCYNDLEPVGRRIRRNSPHMQWAYRERYHYGYDE